MNSRKPLAIDGFCGLGGWAEGFLAEGYDVIGFDIERRPYPGQLVLQDMLTVHGSQFKNAVVLVFSPPCQKYSYMAMPFSRGKKLAKEYRDGTRDVADLTKLFDACFRIQREACEAAGRYIPMVVENVKGAQPWVGRAKWHYGSFYLWGDVPALMPFTKRTKVTDLSALNGHDDPRRGRKNTGGSWFNQAHNTENGVGNNPDGRTPAWVKEFGLPGEPDPHAKHLDNDGIKLPNNGSARRWEDRELPRLNAVKGNPQDGYVTGVDGLKNGSDWFGSGADCSEQRRHASHSSARKAASAQIAKIPFELSRWIAHVYKPG